jgi:site-specific DNA-methyltransferase (cytosine-N4-specific)
LRYEENVPKATVITTDSLVIQPHIFYKKIGLTITSPPYPNAYEYWLYHKYRMYWLRYDPLFVKSKEIGARPLYFKKNPEKTDAFQENISKIFVLLSKVTSDHGYSCFVIGTSKIHGEIVNNSEMIIKAACENGFSPFAFIPRYINQNRKSFNLKNSRAKEEDILIFRKGINSAKKMILHFNDYKYFHYEKIFSARELSSLKGIQSIDLRNKDFVEVYYTDNNHSDLNRLTYFKTIHYDDKIDYTKQNIIEKQQGQRKSQNTRHGVHGLHEYKGKFNPQVVKSILNTYSIFNKKILDPFCGSGTSLIEGAFLLNQSIGFDINPFAVFLTNAKIASLSISVDNIKPSLKEILDNIQCMNNYEIMDECRDKYLSNWFPQRIKISIEQFRIAANKENAKTRDFLLLCMSNILRDYSYQEPSDLRIRMRKSPFPSIDLFDALQIEMNKNLSKIQYMQEINCTYNRHSYALIEDVRSDEIIKKYGRQFDFFITSPPYATALPYIDTQRLSSVWLNLISASQIRNYENILIGSRELTKSQLDKNSEYLHSYNLLPHEVIDICLYLERNLSKNDGFRRQAYPYLLYKYFYDMHIAFRNLCFLLKKGGDFCLIVGKNKSRIGGKDTIIDTPYFLSLIAEKAGYSIQEFIPLETYQRYEAHLKNSIDQEILIVLRKKHE